LHQVARTFSPQNFGSQTRFEAFKEDCKSSSSWRQMEQVSWFFKKCLCDFQFVLKTKNAE